ncbi:MAG: hypothetical protein M2R46_04917 [Verrucomicrobia subdivision 3 bacterium]|nr:hypothetical protein [Limisphaerales bacterium]
MPDVMVPSSDSRTRAGAPAAGRSSQVPGSGPCRSKRALHHSKQMFHLRLHPALPTLGLCVWTPMRRFIPKCSRFFADIGAVENAAINAHAFPQSQALLGQRVVELLKQSVPQAGGASGRGRKFKIVILPSTCSGTHAREAPPALGLVGAEPPSPGLWNSCIPSTRNITDRGQGCRPFPLPWGGPARCGP